MLKVGDMAPPLDAHSDDGRFITFSNLKGHWVLLYFYARLSSPGGRLQLQAFEREQVRFGSLGACVVGIGLDTEAMQARARQKYEIGFPLIPDGGQTIHRRYRPRGFLQHFQRFYPRVVWVNPEGKIASQYTETHRAKVVSRALQTLQTLQESFKEGPKHEPL